MNWSVIINILTSFCFSTRAAAGDSKIDLIIIKCVCITWTRSIGMKAKQFDETKQ